MPHKKTELTNETVDAAVTLDAIKHEINASIKEAGRGENSVIINAVTKTHDAATILPLLKTGHRIFGENRVQEAQSKWPALKEQYEGIELRLIGPLQTNKASEAVALFDVIETVDRPKLARILSEEIKKQGRSPDLLVQVNTGLEPQKAGIAPDGVDEFIRLCRNEYGLGIKGVMAIPPVDADPAPHFALLKEIALRHALEQCSMGMSADYVIAAQLGATHVRIGSAIFGARRSL